MESQNSSVVQTNSSSPIDASSLQIKGSDTWHMEDGRQSVRIESSAEMSQPFACLQGYAITSNFYTVYVHMPLVKKFIKAEWA